MPMCSCREKRTFESPSGCAGVLVPEPWELGACADSGATSASIGMATMNSDGTVVLTVRAEGPGALGDAQLYYPPTHAKYREVLDHVGGLRPGQSKPVPPWP